MLSWRAIYARSGSFLFVIALVGCGSAATADPDGGILLPDISMLPDSPVVPDAGPERFGRCSTDADCPASAPVCDHLYPGGVCTTRCTRDADCGGIGACWADYCAPGCTLGANDCAPYGGNCYDNYPPGADYCIAACYTDAATAPSGWPTCGAGGHCNAWGNYCDPGSAPPPSGGENGAACSTDADCKSQVCFTTAQSPAFIGGECLSYGRQVALADFVNGQPLPQSDCPPGSTVGLGQWLNFGLDEGDSTFCLPSCTADSDCRPGYACGGLVDEGDGRSFATGVCLPVHDCMTNAAHACPTGHTCVASGSFSHCQ